MPWLSTTNQSLTLIIKILVIIFMVAAGAWFLISILGNTLLADNPPDQPDTKFKFLIINTGEYIFTDDYTEVYRGSYILHGYYELKDNKYRWHEKDLPINDDYFGPVVVTSQ